MDFEKALSMPVNEYCASKEHSYVGGLYEIVQAALDASINHSADILIVGAGTFRSLSS